MQQEMYRGRVKANQDLRKAARAANVTQWEIADALGIAEPTLIRRWRRELPDNEKNSMLALIAGLAGHGGASNAS